MRLIVQINCHDIKRQALECIEKGRQKMTIDKLISCFQNTVQLSLQGELQKNTIASINSNKVYKEGFASTRHSKQENASVRVYSGTTFDIAKRYCKYGKVAVLNFANPEVPGGGVQNGAMAQEECLCRSSNLYACISNANVFEDYYGYHRAFKNHFYSDRLIYTKDVIVFKNDDIVPKLMPEEDWFQVDVITCAAPYIAQRKYTNSTALLSLFKRRIKNIFEAARAHDVDNIVLGAFGCGAFKNPPLIVAEAFKKVICEENYLAEFKHIVFAIKPTGTSCANLSTFARHFDEYAGKEECRACLLPEFPEERFIRIPSILNGMHSINISKFETWQRENKYYGKQFSILGDSISTLSGYNPKGYKVFYTGDNCEKSSVIQMRDTWWDNVISYFGGELLVNNSWSGSRVTKLPESDSLFPSGCSAERLNALHINDIEPDVIIVYLGTNDWAQGVNTQSLSGETRQLIDVLDEYFDEAYKSMIIKLQKNYPATEIWCCTLSETFISNNSSFKFPHKYAGIHIEVYNDIIRDIAQKYKCKLIDIYSFHEPYDSIDGSHPTRNGMNTIATEVIRSVVDSEGDMFLDCIDNWCHNETMKEDVPLDSEITTILQSNTLKLMDVNSGAIIQFTQNSVTVGKERSRDLCLSKNSVISRQHATFIYESDCWFLRDDGSTNGTWINGIKLEPGNRYPLVMNDEINFATTDKFIFDRHELKQTATVTLETRNVLHCASDNLIGEIVYEKYELLKIIGKGGTFTVYLAMDRHLCKQWAVKVCDKNNKNPIIIEMALQEVNMVKKLDHPAIPKIVDYIEDSEHIYVVQEYVEGDTLEQLVCLYGPQPVETVIEWGKQICQVMSYLHNLNPPHIYRDMKPANLILMPNGQLKIIDYGIMRLYKEGATEDEICMGTCGYAAPEQFGGKGQTDARTDIYGIGATLYRLLTGINLCEEPVLKPLLEVRTDLPQRLEEIIEKCTQSNPAERFQTCDELLVALEGGAIYSHKKEGIFEKIFGGKKLKSNSDFVSKCMAYSQGEISQRGPLLEQRIEEVDATQKIIWDKAQKNKDIEKRYINDIEYGLVPEKPVFVSGFGSDKEYLSHLHTEDGRKLTFTRLGSFETEGIAGLIDLYILRLSDGTDYLRVYICNYGLSVRKKAPKGTKYID